MQPALRLRPLPEIDLRHFFTLSDDTGILQHATFATADLHHGYCVDDVARALIAATMAVDLRDEPDEETVKLLQDPLVLSTQRYLAFIAYAFNRENGRFRNFMAFDRSWLEEVGSQDSHGRTLWALGTAVRLAPNESVFGLANELMIRAAPAAATFEHIRPVAFSLVGLSEYLKGAPDAGWAAELRNRLAAQLFSIWRRHASDDWPWWEDILTWGNAKLPHAMLLSGTDTEDDAMVEASLKALRWVVEVQKTPEGLFSPIGNNGWYVRGGKPALFDQQPLEAQGFVQACLDAAAITGDDYWVEEAERAFQWFLGRNVLGAPLYNETTGGCHDGLLCGNVNCNQGAESTLAYLLSVLALHHYSRNSYRENQHNPLSVDRGDT
jgi:hypothetical protein